jgi:hypothetical protein
VQPFHYLVSSGNTKSPSSSAATFRITPRLPEPEDPQDLLSLEILQEDARHSPVQYVSSSDDHKNRAMGMLREIRGQLGVQVSYRQKYA